MTSKSAIKILEIHSFASSACRIYPCKGATWAVTFALLLFQLVKLQLLVLKLQLDRLRLRQPGGRGQLAADIDALADAEQQQRIYIKRREGCRVEDPPDDVCSDHHSEDE